jgi:hypothetical protein
MTVVVIEDTTKNKNSWIASSSAYSAKMHDSIFLAAEDLSLSLSDVLPA